MRKISKSLLLKFIRCEKYAYLYVHFPNLRTSITPEQQAIIDRGINVGKLAQNLYPRGYDVSQGGTIKSSDLINETTKALLSDQNVLFEAAFQSPDGNLYCQPDIFIESKRGRRIIEVKSKLEIKLPDHIYDVGFQWHVLNSAGYINNKTSIHIAHPNKEYVLNKELDVEKLFNIEDVTENAKQNQPLIDGLIYDLEKTLNEPACPTVQIGPHCLGNKDQHPCPFKEHCWKENNVPEYSILNVSKLRRDKAFQLYHQYKKPNDVPRKLLSESQLIEIDSANNNQPNTNEARVKAFLGSIQLPRLFTDFESIMSPIPRFNGTSPYQQIVFQYCVLYQKDSLDGIQRREFIAEPKYDPRRKFIQNWLWDTKEAGEIIVYNKNFEITRLKELAEFFPEYLNDIYNRINRIKDLMVPFAKKDYYHPVFKGRYRIKTVLPVLCPDLNYSNMEISNGEIAMRKYEILDQLPLKEQLETKKALREYCYLDTYGMVRIIEELKNIVSKS